MRISKSVWAMIFISVYARPTDSRGRGAMEFLWDRNIFLKFLNKHM